MGKIILVVVFIAIILITYHLVTKNNKKLKKLRKEWETGNFQTLDEPLQSVSSYWANKKNSQSNYDGVDQLTWDDLAMDEVFQKLNYTQSSVGSEYLFNQLRDINPSLVQVQDNEELYCDVYGHTG